MVAIGALTKILLSEFKVDILSHVISIGGVFSNFRKLSFESIRKIAEASPVRCCDKRAEKAMKAEIDTARSLGDSLGGICDVITRGVLPGLGGLSQWDRRLDGNLARSIMSIPAVKGVSIGGGFDLAEMTGREVHDAVFYNKKRGFYRITNNAGGLEGGITNGENIIVRLAMKPISTLKKPLESVDIITKKIAKAQVERADVCAVAACGVVAEAACSFEIANAMIEKFGGDSLLEMKRNVKGYVEQIRKF